MINVNEDNKSLKEMHKSVSIVHLVCISFFYVCAGPFGQGEAIAAGGAKWTFIFTIIVPIVFSIPLALISSEQASRFPACGGCAEWGLILGKFVGTLNTYVRTLCSIFDNAIYPVMAFDYLIALIPKMNRSIYKFIVVLVSNALVLFLNISGLETVGSVSFILTIIIILPILLFFFFGASKITADKIFADKPSKYGPVDWPLLLSTLIWQYSGFDTIAALSEETKNPKRSFPIALSITIVLVTLVYLLPTISGLSVEPDLDKWKSSAFSEISKKLPHCENGWLSICISVAGIFSALSLLNIAISCTGRETYASALLDSFPFSSFLARLDNNMKHQPLPIVSLTFMSLMTIPFSFFDFSILVEWSGLLTVIQQMIQIASFIALRFPSMVERMKREQAELRQRAGIVDSQSSEQDIIRIELSNSDEDDDENESKNENSNENDFVEDLSNKFIIPGGWFGVAIVCLPLLAISVFLCIVQGWISLLACSIMIAGLFLIKEIEIEVRKFIEIDRAHSPNDAQTMNEDTHDIAEII